jgi:hypothetical protein
MKEPKYRSGTRLAIVNVAKRLNVSFEDWMQDWPIEAVKASDIDIYINQYESCRNDDEKFVLMEAIIQAIEEQPSKDQLEKYWELVKPILIGDLKIHEYTIYYWSRFDATEGTERWKISERMREIWDAMINH